MTDNFDKLKDALQRDPPPPGPDAKAHALARAMEGFAKKNTSTVQGMAAGMLPTSSGGTGPSEIWSSIMTAMKPSNWNWSPVVATGASLAVLTLAVISTQGIRPDLFDREDDVVPQLTKPAPPQDARARREAMPAPQDEAVAAAPPSATPRMADEAQDFASGPVTAEQKSRGVLLGFAPPPRAADGAGGIAPMGTVAEMPAPVYRDQGRDRFETFDQNPVKVAAEDPVSTFSIDVDTASYAFMRARVKDGVLPPADSVRVEEYVNYFPYDYAAPDTLDTPFKANVSVMPTPWNSASKLMRIGIKGYAPKAAAKPRYSRAARSSALRPCT